MLWSLLAVETLFLKFKCFYTINLIFQMDTEEGDSDGGEIGEETELNILQGFDFDQNPDATWLLTSPTNSPEAGSSVTASTQIMGFESKPWMVKL